MTVHGSQGGATIMGAGAVYPTGPTPAPTQPGPEMTHVEIRRVQNGFVVAAINANLHENMMGYQGPQRSTFIAKDTKELADVLEWMITGAEIKWLPTIDMPVFDALVRRPGLVPTESVKQAVAEGIQQAMGPPQMLAEGQMPAHDANKFYGGPLNTGRPVRKY